MIMQKLLVYINKLFLIIDMSSIGHTLLYPYRGFFMPNVPEQNYKTDALQQHL